VSARLPGDVVGMFLLDTGSNHTVYLSARYVERHLISEIRELGRGTSFGVAGARPILHGSIAWFELAGYRFDRPTIAYTLPVRPPAIGASARGPLIEEVFDGIIGHGFMREFTVVFNYPKSQVAFLAQKPPRSF
jgi:hypothetical protein